MTRLATAAVAALVAGAMSVDGAAPATPQEPAQTFRAATDAVRVDVSVRDGRRAVAGLTTAEFEVFDNGVRQVVTDVTYARVPIDVTVVLDVSASVTGRLLDQLRRAVLQLMRDLGGEDRLRLMHFNMRIRRVVDFTSDTAEVERAIQDALAGGGSSIRDTIGVALVSALPPDRRQLVVVFTDGADSTSTISDAALIEVAKRTTAAVTAVVPDQLRLARPNTLLRGYLRALEGLARETGGIVVTSGGNLTSTFRRALEEFRSSYVLHFTPTGVERGGFHELDVRVARGGNLEVRARRGYFGG
jgi:VWFA-related protein